MLSLPQKYIGYYSRLGQEFECIVGVEPIYRTEYKGHGFETSTLRETKRSTICYNQIYPRAKCVKLRGLFYDHNFFTQFSFQI